MSMFRSTTMVHKKIRIPREHAAEFMDELGKNTEGVEFIDMNKNNLEGKKNFYGMIKRCDNIEKHLTSMEKVCERFQKDLIKYTSYQNFLLDIEIEEKSIKRSGKNLFDSVEHEVAEDEKKIVELINSYDSISENLDYIKEKKAVYDKISQLILSGTSDIFDIQKNQKLASSEEELDKSGINTIAGVVKAEDEIKMKRMIFRISRGRATPTFFDLEIRTSANKEKIIKKIFTIFFPGGPENILLQKLIKVCDIYNASRFSIPRYDQIKSEIVQLQNDINEKEGYLKQAKTLIDDFLKEKIGAALDNKAAKYDLYKQFIRKQKYIYINLNKCVLTDNFVDGEIWVTEENFPKVQEEINKLSADLSMSANFSDIHLSNLTPPTHIKTNDLTWAFQEITDAYGIPRYGEVNPSLYSIVTFPFLFGIMFGDIGHGGLLLLFSLYLIIFSEDIKRSNSPLKLGLKAKYLLLFMGISSFYMGWMYNDFISIPINLFGSCYINVKSYIF